MKKTTTLSILLTLICLSSCKNNNEEMADLKINLNNLSSEISQLNQDQLTIENNKKVVTSFYQEFFGDYNFDAANKYIGDIYIQHNPAVADGRQALINAAEMWFQGATKKKINFNLVIAEKDLVYVQIISESNGTRQSTMDVFRVTDGKISEHWDAFNTFKKEAKSQNDNPLF